MQTQVSITNMDIMTLVKSTESGHEFSGKYPRRYVSQKKVVGKSQKVGGLAIQYAIFLEFFLVTSFLNHAGKSISDLEKHRGGPI